MPGFLGTGVEAGSIQRIRDSFVDHQFRSESTKLGYWESRSNAIAQMEDVIGEPSEYGLQQSMSDFWQSLQTLAANPENGGARAVVVERGAAVADSFNYIYKSVSEIKGNLGDEIDFGTKTINSLLSQIGELNKQIATVEPNGYLPNDLYDARDGLLDQLSSLVPIETSYVPTGGRAPAIAEGTVTVKIKTITTAAITVVRGGESSEISVNTSGTGKFPNVIDNFHISGKPAVDDPNKVIELDIDNMPKTGELRSLVDSYGYKTPTGVKGLYPEMLAKLDKMANEFAKEFNIVHGKGTDLEGKPGLPFFVGDVSGEFTASSIAVNDVIRKDPNKLAASDSTTGAEVGNGKNAKNLGDVFFAKNDALEGSSIQSFYAQVIGQLGVEGQQAIKMTDSSGTLLLSVSNRRDSISSVSLDEEMTDMIRFQQAYNASARMITVMDEALDKIINGMGTVGR